MLVSDTQVNMCKKLDETIHVHLRLLSQDSTFDLFNFFPNFFFQNLRVAFSFHYWNEMCFSCQICWLAHTGQGICPGSSIAGNWSSYCDKAFLASVDPDVHFRCCISADTKIQASIKHETDVKPIHRKTWLLSSLCVYSGALDELTSQRSTVRCSFSNSGTLPTSS